MKRKLVVFGAGPHARDLLVPTLLSTNRCELTAWVDPAEVARRLALEKFPDVPVVADLDLARVESGALAVIATPTATHRGLFKAVYERGLDCFIEKPLAATFADARAMCERLRPEGPQATVGLWMRHSPLIQRLAQWLPAPRSSELIVRAPQVPADNKVRLLDTFVYLLDLALATHRTPPVGLQVVRKNPPECVIAFADQSRARLVWQDARPAGKNEKWQFTWTDKSCRAQVCGLTRLTVQDGHGRNVFEERAEYHDGFRYQFEQLLDGRFLVPLSEAAHANQWFDVLAQTL